MAQYKTTECIKKEEGYLGVCDLSDNLHRFNQFMSGPRGRGHCVNFRITSNILSRSIIPIVDPTQIQGEQNVGMESDKTQPIPETSTEI